ncbi:hypothetical protein LIA77_04664 [Sarocladium implicatum]|jgi:hypothetical protein|nr:hypothetical protein LIA77_04664 [Sarocladium implicatum]
MSRRLHRPPVKGLSISPAGGQGGFLASQLSRLRSVDEARDATGKREKRECVSDAATSCGQRARINHSQMEVHGEEETRDEVWQLEEKTKTDGPFHSRCSVASTRAR